MAHPDFFVLGMVALLSFGLSYLGSSVGLVFGQLRLPILVYWLGSPAVGAATSLAISAVAALVGAARHARAGRVDVRLMLSIGLPSAVAAWLATRMAVRLDPALVKGCIGLALVLTGGMMLRSRGRPTQDVRKDDGGVVADAKSSVADPDARGSGSTAGAGAEAPAIAGTPPRGPGELGPPPLVRAREASESEGGAPDSSMIQRGPVPRGRLLFEVIVGVVLGAVAGIVGLLLGTLRLPAMMKLGVHPARAVGTNMAIGSMTGLLAGAAALVEGNVDPWAFGVITPATMVGAYWGASATGKLDKATLRRLIAWTLLGIGVWMAAEPWW
jgi:uncharacterized membrane protein YfcA